MRIAAIIPILELAAAALAQSTRPAGVIDDKLPFIQIDLQKRQVRMECEAVNAEMALEYLVCVAGASEHETVLRSRARPSHLHLALTLIGAEAGEPAHFDRANKRAVPPKGERLRIACEFTRDGKPVRIPACRLMRNQKTKAEMPETMWIFAGSLTGPDGEYAADIRGRLISVVNFEDSTVDVPAIRSNSNESLEWEVNPKTAPARGAKVWLVIEREKDGK